MNFQIKNIILNSGLFEEDPDAPGLYFAQKNNKDCTKELNKIIQEISDEYVRAIEIWKESPDEANNEDYVEGYDDACNDILEEIKERFT